MDKDRISRGLKWLVYANIAGRNFVFNEESLKHFEEFLESCEQGRKSSMHSDRKTEEKLSNMALYEDVFCPVAKGFEPDHYSDLVNELKRGSEDSEKELRKFWSRMVTYCSGISRAYSRGEVFSLPILHRH